MTFGNVGRTFRDFPRILGTFYKRSSRSEISYADRGRHLSGPNDARKDHNHAFHPQNIYAVKKQCVPALFHSESSSLGSAIFPDIFALRCKPSLLSYWLTVWPARQRPTAKKKKYLPLALVI